MYKLSVYTNIIFFIIIINSVSSETKFFLSYDPITLRELPWGKMKNVSFRLTVEQLEDMDLSQNYYLLYSYKKPEQFPRDVINIVHNSKVFIHFKSNNTRVYSFTSYVTIEGSFLGYANISAKLFNAKTNALIKTFDNYIVTVKRTFSIIEYVFSGLLYILFAINYVNMGCQLDMNVVKNTIKTPIGPIIGFVCQFTIMPLASYLIGWLLLEDKNIRLGLFTLGCSPGGTSSNFYTLLFNGDVDLSITMTFFSSVAAFVMMPLWLFTLGSTLFDGGELTIPYDNLIYSLLSLTIPLLIGIAIKLRNQNLAQFSDRIIRPFTIFLSIISFIISGVFYNFFLLLFTWRIIIAGFLVTISGYGLGALSAMIFKLKRPQIIAISIETAFQNAGIAFIVLFVSLKQPDGDIASVPCVAQLLITGQPLLFIYIGYRLRERFRSKKSEKNDCPVNNDKTISTDESDNKMYINLGNSNHNDPYNKTNQTINNDTRL